MKHTKRYGIVFDKWSIYKQHQDITEFDTIKEVNEEIELLEEMYKDTPRPEHRYSRSSYCNRNSTDISNYVWCSEYVGESFWGYLVVDFEEERILRWGHDCLKHYNKESDIKRLKDWLFRKEDEVPADYKWDVGEYQGWLQFRWGDGKNSIKNGDEAVIETQDRWGKKSCTCVRNCRCSRKKKKKFVQREYNELEEAELDKLNAEILQEVEAEKV